MVEGPEFFFYHRRGKISTMTMNIKNEEAHRLASEIAKETGQTLTQVVIDALRDRAEELDKFRREAEFTRIRLLMAQELKGKLTSCDINDILYDPETGLPH